MYVLIIIIILYMYLFHLCIHLYLVFCLKYFSIIKNIYIWHNNMSTIHKFFHALALSIIEELGPPLGLTVNTAKCEFF